MIFCSFHAIFRGGFVVRSSPNELISCLVVMYKLPASPKTQTLREWLDTPRGQLHLIWVCLKNRHTPEVRVSMGTMITNITIFSRGLGVPNIQTDVSLSCMGVAQINVALKSSTIFERKPFSGFIQGKAYGAYRRFYPCIRGAT